MCGHLNSIRLTNNSFLQDKLEALAVLCQWVAAFAKKRSLKARVSEEILIVGVQWSAVLGSQHFRMLIKVLPVSMTSRWHMFVDDAKLICSSHEVSTLLDDLTQILLWISVWNIDLM